jgi:hypothetical protein
MSFYMATTKIEPGKTAAEITALLGRKGAKSILTEYECGEIVALSFLIEREGKEIPFRLPLRWENCLEAMKRDRQTPRHLLRVDQAKRTAWRIILRWIEAQFALIDTGMASLMEVMLPYVQVAPNQTFYERIEGDKFKMLPERT